MKLFLVQKNINKYVYSSDEYVSGSSDESENEVIAQLQDKEERSEEQIIEEIVKLTSEIYDLDYAK